MELMMDEQDPEYPLGTTLDLGIAGHLLTSALKPLIRDRDNYWLVKCPGVVLVDCKLQSKATLNSI